MSNFDGLSSPVFPFAEPINADTGIVLDAPCKPTMLLKILDIAPQHYHLE